MKHKLNFEEETHTYTYDGEVLLSVTQFLKNFKVPFDREGISKKCAAKRGITQEQVLKMWDEKCEKACKKGTAVHAYAEGVARLKQSGQFKPFKVDKYYPEMEMVNLFFEEHPYLKPLYIEVMTFNLKYKIAGTMDYICQDERDGKIYLLDYKTNEKLDFYSKYKKKLLFPLETIDDCHINNYLLQLNLYKFLIEDDLGIKIDGLKIVHFTTEKYSIHDCRFVEEEIEMVLKYRLRELGEVDKK